MNRSPAKPVTVRTDTAGRPQIEHPARVAHRLTDPEPRADIADNADPSRLALLDQATRGRLETKCAKALAAVGAQRSVLFT